MSFTNLYYKRTAGTERPCYVCCKPTTTVLATINTVDFLYACPAHLKDPGFTSPVGESSDGTKGARKMGLTPEEIAKIKEEWEEKQKTKQKKEKEKREAKEEKKDETKDGEGIKEKDKGAVESKSPKTPPTPPAPVHERYILHRDFFAMRLTEHRKKRQAAQAKELAPRLPGAPSGSFGSQS